jgi:iron complex outermembrane receptor protein/hemoglobin/transferrin/lactoferrin receptor protein
MFLTLALGAHAQAQDAAPAYTEASPSEEGEPAQGEPAQPQRDEYDVETVGTPSEFLGRAGSKVTREEFKLRLPRSAPDALRYEPGVYIQQTAHGQGSPFIRGRTGQQTVLLFDGVRLNNSLFRQGPNQYFFTIDSQVVESLEVLRGSASTRYSTDAMAGVILARPIEPRFERGEGGLRLKPTVSGRFTTADDERGGRVQLEGQVGPRVGFVVGVGAREVGLLESAGPLYSPEGVRQGDGVSGVQFGPDGREIPWVARFDEDWRTQLGTGFDELTWDVRLVGRLTPKLKATAGWYEYRQFDAPRTDNCPPPEAPLSECLVYDEQFRSLALLKLETEQGAWMQNGTLTLSYQRQHERRTQDRPQSFTRNGGRDDAHSVGARFLAATEFVPLGPSADARLHYGADFYRDSVESRAWFTFTDVEVTRYRSRGQYMDGSTYTWAGAFVEGEAILWDALVTKLGTRAATSDAYAPGDEESSTVPVNQSWPSAVANAGLEWWVVDGLSLLLNVDQGFRAPNLDDLTSRQQTGPGFQFENADLKPERALTVELGTKAEVGPLTLDAWAYHLTLDDLIARQPVAAADCPDSACRGSRNPFRLINLPDASTIWGAEGSAALDLPLGLSARATLSYAFGEGPSPSDPTQDEPLSRVPPLNGTAELLWRHPQGAYFGGALRWATLQDRLALADTSDPRIPRGGTPGFQVWDLRMGWRKDPYLLVAAVLENVTDEVYRYHGSSINGPARGINLQIEASY